MDHIKESVNIPRLTDFGNNNLNVPMVPSPVQSTKVITKDTYKFYLNVVVFILFVCFIIFFLFNCKNGRIFSGGVDNEPIPYNINHSRYFDKLLFF